jgi:hypothetical protein
MRAEGEIRERKTGLAMRTEGGGKYCKRKEKGWRNESREGEIRKRKPVGK